MPDELLMLLIVPVDNYTRKGGEGDREMKAEWLTGTVAWLVTRSLANFMGANKPRQVEWATSLQSA